MRQHEVRVEVKRPLERLHGGFHLALLLENGGKEMMITWIQLVGTNSLFTPLECLCELAQVGVDARPKRQRLCICWMPGQPCFYFFRCFRIATLLVQCQGLVVRLWLWFSRRSLIIFQDQGFVRRKRCLRLRLRNKIRHWLKWPECFLRRGRARPLLHEEIYSARAMAVFLIEDSTGEVDRGELRKEDM